jgi:hypothetical protein
MLLHIQGRTRATWPYENCSVGLVVPDQPKTAQEFGNFQISYLLLLESDLSKPNMHLYNLDELYAMEE